jgi:hypothetical protein
MDRATLLAHRHQWVTEPNPVDTTLETLDPPEAALYRDLCSDALGRSIRLEQERVRYSLIEQALGMSRFAGNKGQQSCGEPIMGA